MDRLLVVNGPNLNLLGTRQPEVYGTASLADVESLCAAAAASYGVETETFQSNHEGAILDRLHQRDFDALVINPGALTHYSYALHDAIAAVERPAVEVHISNIRAREEWRRHSVVAPACVYTIFGRGVDGYADAIRHLHFRTLGDPRLEAYGPGHQQIGDVRLPGGPGPHPIVVLLHGGFWKDEWTRDLMDGLAVALAADGFATWNVEYSRVGAGGGWPATLQDVARAIDHVPQISGVDPLRVALVGHSAGGQLALWAASRPALDAGAPGSEPAVLPSGVIALAAVADLMDAARYDNGATAAFLGHSPPDRRYAAASPQQLSLGSVPAVLIHGDRDDTVPVDVSTNYAAAHATADAHVIPNAGHMDMVDPGAAAYPVIRSAIRRLIG